MDLYPYLMIHVPAEAVNVGSQVIAWRAPGLCKVEQKFSWIAEPEGAEVGI